MSSSQRVGFSCSMRVSWRTFDNFPTNFQRGKYFLSLVFNSNKDRRSCHRGRRVSSRTVRQEWLRVDSVCLRCACGVIFSVFFRGISRGGIY